MSFEVNRLRMIEERLVSAQRLLLYQPNFAPAWNDQMALNLQTMIETLRTELRRDEFSGGRHNGLHAATPPLR